MCYNKVVLERVDSDRDFENKNLINLIKLLTSKEHKVNVLSALLLSVSATFVKHG